MPQAAPAQQFEIGKYLCPNTKKLLPIWALQHLAEVEWPVTVEKCPDCGQKHLVRNEDVLHPPLFGYE